MYRNLAAVAVATSIFLLVFLMREEPGNVMDEPAVVPSHQPAESHPAEDQLAHVRQELNAVARQAAADRDRLRARIEAREAAELMVPAPAAPDAYEPERVAIADVQLAEARRYVSTLEQHMDSSGGPAAFDWAGGQLRSALAERGIVGAELTHSACTDSLCRLDLQFEDEVARNELLMSIGTVLGNSDGFFFSDPDTPGVTQLFVAPEGVTLPTL